MSRKPTIEDYVDAVIDRDSGMPYKQVLEEHDLKPRQFYNAVTRDLIELINSTSGDKKNILQAIDSDPEMENELFRMDEGLLREQYRRVREGEQKRFYEGTYLHPENVENIVYIALTTNNQILASSDRTEVINGISALPSNLQDYLHSLGLGGFYIALTTNNQTLASSDRAEVINGISALPTDLTDYLRSLGLGGLMVNGFKGKEQSSPLAVLKAFDRAYQRKKGNNSLFDLSEKEHLHEWGDSFHAPQSYWQDPTNVEEAVYHILTENNQTLASSDRTEVINGINALPSNLQYYLHSLGLGGLMVSGFKGKERGSPLAVLKAFDRAYQRKKGNNSLFDLTQKEHLHEWGDKFSAPQSYWQNSLNVENTVYHVLVENNHKLASDDRAEVVKAIKALPTNLGDYLCSIGLAGLMDGGFKKEEQDSPLAVLKAFDRAYQRITEDASLFDLTQKEHLHEWGDKFNAPHSYWQDPTNIEEAVYHILTENNQTLASSDRAEVVEAIKALPTNLGDYLHSLGLGVLMAWGFKGKERGSPLAVLKAFDRAYQRKKGDNSLFDITQEDNLKIYGKNRVVR